MWVDREGREEVLPAPPANHDFPRLSPEGRRLAVTVADGGQRDIGVWNLARNLMVPVTTSEATELFPAWASDGSRITYMIPAAGIWEKRADGSGQAEMVGPTQWTHAFTSAGDQLLVTRTMGRLRPDGTGGIGVMSAQDPSVRWLLVPPAGEARRNPSLSPDDRWLVYESDETGTSEIFVRGFPDVEVGLQLVSTAGGVQPVWSRDGRELFYLEPGAPPRLMAVSVTPGEMLGLGPPQPLMAWPYGWDRSWHQRLYDVDPSGHRFLALKPVAAAADASPQSQLFIVQNWTEELKRLEPVD